VLEVGAGIGSNIDYLFNPQVQDWLALEPDPKLTSVIAERQRTGQLPQMCKVLTGTLDDAGQEQFDTILYIDVLEHIEQDRAQVAQAASRLRPNGRLIILSPAHQFLFSPFDASIGHFRRYGANQLKQLTPPGCRPERLRMLDSTGFFLSLANRLIMKSAMPTHGQIALWDRVFVRVSTVLDPVLGYRFGKSILLIWKKADGGPG
jgi:SAM-dependent methyltransferase